MPRRISVPLRYASLVVLTDKGCRTYDEAGRLQAPWANGLSEDMAIKDIDTTRRVVAELRKKLELNGERASTRSDQGMPAGGSGGLADEPVAEIVQGGEPTLCFCEPNIWELSPDKRDYRNMAFCAFGKGKKSTRGQSPILDPKLSLSTLASHLSRQYPI